MDPGIRQSAEKNSSIVDCYLALFDILGFKSIIESQPLDSASKSLDKLERILNTLRGREDIGYPEKLDVRWFQDTLIIIVSGDAHPRLSLLIRYCSSLVALAFAEGIFLRGAITNGELYITPTAAFGVPLVHAYSMEQNQEWIGCWVDIESVKAADNDSKRWLRENNMIFPYPVPFKNGDVRSQFVLNWPLCLISESGLEALRSGWDKLAANGHHWQVLRKIHNTDRFLQFLVAQEWRPQLEPNGHAPDSMRMGRWIADYDLYSVSREIKRGIQEGKEK